MVGNSEVIMRLERMVEELVVKNARLERRVAELEERLEGVKVNVFMKGEQIEWLRARYYDAMDQLDETENQLEETDAKAEMLIDDVALLDERTMSLNKPKHTGGLVSNTEIKIPKTISRSAEELAQEISDNIEAHFRKGGRRCSD